MNHTEPSDKNLSVSNVLTREEPLNFHSERRTRILTDQLRSFPSADDYGGAILKTELKDKLLQALNFKFLL